MGRLTQTRIRTLSSPGRYGDGDGLWLQVRDGRRRSWLFRYERLGRARAMGLGSLDLVTLAEAREAAWQARKLLQQGLDPIEHRRAKRTQDRLLAGRSFKDVAEQYIADNWESWRNPKHRAQWRSTLATYVYPQIGALPVCDITTAEVTTILRPIWLDKSTTARRLRGRLEQILDFAIVHDWHRGPNPARWKGHLAKAMPAGSKPTRHHPALPWAEIGPFMAALRDQAGIAVRSLAIVAP